MRKSGEVARVYAQGAASALVTRVPAALTSRRHYYPNQPDTNSGQAFGFLLLRCSSFSFLFSHDSFTLSSAIKSSLRNRFTACKKFSLQ